MGATIDINVYWTGEDYAADGNTYDWENPTGNNWRLVSDDSALGAGNFPGATGCTLNFLDSTAGLPDTNLANAGESFVIVIRDDVTTGWFQPGGVRLQVDILGAGDWNYTDLTLGGVDDHTSTISIDQNSAGGTITVHCVAAPAGNLANGIVVLESGAVFSTWGGDVLTQKITVNAGGTYRSAVGGSILNGGCDLAGTIWLADGSVLDSIAAVTVTASGATIDWNYEAGGVGTISGGLDANGYTVTHSNTTGATLTCDAAGNLDLGADVPLLTIDIQANTVLTRDLSCLDLTVTSGNLNMAGQEIVLAGTLLHVGGTITSAGAQIHDGTVQDVVCTGVIHRFGATADTGNDVNVVDCPSPIGPGVALMAA